MLLISGGQQEYVSDGLRLNTALPALGAMAALFAAMLAFG
jgi:hypothetical protein